MLFLLESLQLFGSHSPKYFRGFFGWFPFSSRDHIQCNTLGHSGVHSQTIEELLKVEVLPNCSTENSSSNFATGLL